MSRAGFTLVEMLVALAIMALLTSLALALRPVGGPPAVLKAEARGMAGALRAARGRALADNRPVVFMVDVGERRYGVPPDWRRLPKAVTVAVVAAREEMATPEAVGIRFYPDGSATGGRVRLAQGGRRLDITVDWLTGRARVADATE